jgi:hypothetical protein
LAASGPADDVTFKELPASSLRLPAGLYDPLAGGGVQMPVMPPLIVSGGGRKGYTVVDGCKRLMSLKRGNQARIPCEVVERPLDRSGLGLMRIQLNRGRLFSLREKILLLKWLARHCRCEQMEAAHRDLGVSPQDWVMLAPLASARDKALVGAVASGALHLALVRSFLLLSRADRQAFLRAFQGAKLSLQTQREFLEWLVEIVQAQRVSVRRLLQQRVFRDVFRERRLNWPQRILRIRALLHARRFPRLSEAERAWRAAAAKANPAPSQVSFIHSPSFEKNRLEIRVTATSPGSAQATLSKLAAIPGQTWEKLVYPLRDAGGS